MSDKATAKRANTRKTLQGVVVSNKMDKSILVKVERITEHPIYRKRIKRSKKYHTHDQENRCAVGDVVKIMECRPLSRMKRWRLVEVLNAAKR